MDTIYNNYPKTRLYFFFLGLYVLAYGWFLLAQPVALVQAQFDLSYQQIQVLRVTVVLLQAVIWYLALFSALAVYRFAHRVRGNVAESGYMFIAVCLLILLVNLVLTSSLATIRSYLENQIGTETWVYTLRLATTYLQIACYLGAFWCAYLGSRRLLAAAGYVGNVRMRRLGVSAVVLGISIVFVLFVLLNPYRSISTVPDIHPTYGVSDVLIFTTIVMPFSFIWWLGIKSTVNIALYRRQVQGVLYRTMLRNFDIGILLILLTVISTEILRQMTALFTDAPARIIVFMVYAILGVFLIGYTLIARSAKRLEHIGTPKRV